jgi:two-component system chemotaxis response regulator CheY
MVLCLIVDDDKASSKIAADVAGQMGLEVAIENSGASAITFCGSRMPDVIILDVYMPKMDGVEFLRQLHKMIGGRKPYVIGYSAGTDINVVKALKDEGINAYIVKPFSTAALQAKIKESGKV